MIEEVGSVAYRLALLDESKVHNVFHASLLKKKEVTFPPSQPHYVLSLKTRGPIIEPLHILNYCYVKKGTKFFIEALVQWKYLALEDATWKDTEQLQQQFSSINHADKANL